MEKRNLIPLLALSAIAISANAATTTQFYALTKGVRYGQIGVDAPVALILPQIPFRVRAFVYSSAPTSGSVRTPLNATFGMTTAGDHIEYTADYTAFGTMNGIWTQGNFTFTITSASDGTKNPALNLSTDSYPFPARISNFNEAQIILVTQPFVLTWDPLGRPVSDFAYLRIDGDGAKVFESSPIPGTASALNGGSTSVTIPANRLQEGKAYTCSLTVWRAIDRDTTTIPGAAGQTAYTAETIFPIRTRFNILDVRQYGIEKRFNYEQASAIPVLRADPFDMITFAIGSAPGSITAANFKPPSGALRNMTAAGADFAFVQSFVNLTALEAAFPPGAYDLQITTKNNGIRTNRITLPGDSYPGIPQISNFDEAQYLKTTGSITISWASTDATANDFAQLIVYDGLSVVYSTPAVLGAPGALNGSNRSVTFSGTLLTPGKSYTGTLRIFRPTSIDTVNYPVAIGVVGFSRLTRFPMNTASGPSPQPRFTMPRRVGNQTEVKFDSIRGEIYRIQTTQNFPGWTTLQTVTAAGPETTVLLPATSLSTGFYRIMIGP